MDKQVKSVTQALRSYMPGFDPEESAKNICQDLDNGNCTLNEAVACIQSALSPVADMPGRITDQKLRDEAVSKVLCAWILPASTYPCRLCEHYAYQTTAPSHRGSRGCYNRDAERPDSGSIASGGKYSHCTCDACF